MTTIKIILRKKHDKDGNEIKNKDGTFPITMRMTKDRKTSFIYLGYAVKENDWDESTQRVKKSHPNHARLNNYIIKKLSEANNTALDLETNKTDVTVKTVRNKLKPEAGSTFFSQAESYLARLKTEGKYNQYTPDKSRVKHFRDFVGKDIAFQDITPALLDRFKGHLMSKFNLKARTAINTLVVIRSVFSQAIKDNIVDPKHYPFGKGKTKIKFPDSIKIGLMAEEVKAIENVDLTDPVHHHARNLWLFSFYFAGMRASDVFRMKWSDFQDNRLYYAMGKNLKGGSFKIPEKAQKIIEQYKGTKENDDDFIFPELKGCNLAENSTLKERLVLKQVRSISVCASMWRRKLGLQNRSLCILPVILSGIFQVIKFLYRCCKNFIGIQM